ncbi:MAG: hypothetical protein MNPFHGCM_01002 [Gemmatimonadaceae bacterium]|nr:hypothetical protein [Gemmatimonadaceae bacterium]
MSEYVRSRPARHHVSVRPIPELLAPAGSLDAVRAAVANGANAIYLGVEKFNARDEGAQLSMAELEIACATAHSRGVRIYLTLNTLIKPAELDDALRHLGACIDAGIDAAIVQDIGLVSLIRRVYPGFELHGSTQMTVHDADGARLMSDIGVHRVVLARENTLNDIRAIRDAVPDLGLESFVHGALCISYSGQCLMSGMISERSANRGACAQACRKDYILRDAATRAELDRGYLISARDLAAHDHLGELAQEGIGCLKIEGRKKKPEYVATVTHGYRTFLDRLASGSDGLPSPEEVRPLVQIFSRGFTGGMYGGRVGRDYVTREHPDNRGHAIGVVVDRNRGEIVIAVSHPVAAGDGLAFEPPDEAAGNAVGCAIDDVRTLSSYPGGVRQAIVARLEVRPGWRVVRSSQASLNASARESFATIPLSARPRIALHVRCFGSAGSPLKALVSACGTEVSVTSELPLAPAREHALDVAKLREHFDRLGETQFALGDLDARGLAERLFLPVSELNRLRQHAVAQLQAHIEWSASGARAERDLRISQVVSRVETDIRCDEPPGGFALSAEVFLHDDALAAADGGATHVVFDPFLRHPAPSRASLSELRDILAQRGVELHLKLPTIVRPDDRPAVERWLDLDMPVVTGHAGMATSLARRGRTVTADYAVNCFNQHTAAEFFNRGVRRLVASVELTVDELRALTSPWAGRGFDVVLYGRPEGMTLEHCVLSAAFSREPRTCRDLCVRSHPDVELTDPAGYPFPVATDVACRNRLLHSRPIDGSEFLSALWRIGVRGFRLLLNVHGLPVREIVSAYRQMLDSLVRGERPGRESVRAIVGREFTRGHYNKAV